ncbi:SGNH/GDSL hydrolase family protein [Nocardioides zeicaulis]|uniref:SGNH/GDSL hydrolase family protein n=1 Tax=Nocardioides zeicaulis TaxID=1776857 RepID=A0ABV6E0F2_9ACTN
MLHSQNVRRALGASAIAVVLGAAMAFYVADSADAGQTRCRDHRADARERSAIVTGEGGRVLVIGDSWSVGLGQDDLARSWPSRLDGEVHVAGFSGSGFSARASGCGTVSFADRAPTALGVRPALVVVEGGLNDYDQPAAAIDDGFRDLMADLAGERVVVVGPASAPSRAAAVPRVDALLAELSAEYGVPYVQTSDLALDYLDDELHLTEGGHAEFGDVVADRIAANSPARPAVLPR